MKKHVNLWLVMFLAISLALPIYSMAQTKLTLEDSTGNRISTPGIKSFAVGTDNNLVILLDQPFNFTDLIPDIFLTSCTNCSITAAAGVTVTQGASLSFNVQSSDTNAVISLVAASYEIALPNTLPITLPSTGGSATFSWPTGDTPTGSYIAVFQATAPNPTEGTSTSQIVVMIKIGIAVSASVSSGNGTVSPASQIVNSGDSASITITPNSGNHIASITDNDTAITSFPSSGAYTYTINNVTTNHNVVVTFAVDTFTVTASVVNPAGGTVSPASRTVNYGGTATFTATTNSGYTASVSEGTLSGGTWTIPNVTSTHTATVTFNSNTCTVTASWDSTKGTVSPASRTVNYGGTATFAVTPNAGYSASVSEGSLSGTTWTISNVTSTHTATVTFSTNTYTVTASVVNSAGGSVSPASQTVNYGGTATFTVTTNSGYTASVSAGSLSGSTWTISNVTSNLSATITFTYSGGGGASGTKTNPIKINKPTTKVANGYIPSTSLDNSRGTYVIKAGQKVYFELDPLATTGRSVLAFGLQIKFYNQSLPVCKLIQDKTTGNYSTEVCRIGGYADIVYDNSPYEIDNTKFLYAIDNSSCTSSGVCDFTDDIWAEIP